MQCRRAGDPQLQRIFQHGWFRREEQTHGPGSASLEGVCMPHPRMKWVGHTRGGVHGACGGGLGV